MSKKWYEEHLFHRIKSTENPDTDEHIEYDEDMNIIRITNQFKEIRYRYNRYGELIYVSEISSKTGNILIETYYDRDGDIIYKRVGNSITDGKKLAIEFEVKE